MNDETKEILIDLVDYYNTVGTPSDPGIGVFEHIAQRASRALKRHAKQTDEGKQINSADVDPFEHVSSLESISKHGYEKGFELYKLEDEW